MPIFKIEKNGNYTVMSNFHLRNKELSLKGKGLLSYMLSNPDDWNYSLSGLVASCKEGKDAVNSTLQELKRHGYLIIERCRGPDGKFEYIYHIFEVPFHELSKNKNLPYTDFPGMVKPNMENPPQLNTKELIDKKDKTGKPETKHHYLTLELIKTNYISEDDTSSFYFDELFQEYLSKGYSNIELLGAIHYIVPRVISRNFKDDNGNPIESRYGYFKSSMESNFEKLSRLSEDLYSDRYDIEGR